MDKAPLIVTDLIATLNSKSRAKVNGFKMI